MMKFRRAIAFILCAVLALPLIACNKDTRGTGGAKGPTYTLTFVLDDAAKAAGATVHPETMEVTRGKSVGEDGQSLPVPTGYPGYVFDYWDHNGDKIDASRTIGGDWTLTAKWIDATEISDYERNMDWAESGHLYIHYKRYSHDVKDERTSTAKPAGGPDYNTAINSEAYGDWGLWLWPKNDEGRLFNAAWIDESGAVYDVLLDHTYGDAGWDGDNKVGKNIQINYKDATSIGMQLFQISTRTGSGFWANDGDNNYLSIRDLQFSDGSYHWFVTQGEVGKGSKHYISKSLVDPYKGIPKGSAITFNDTTGAKFVDANDKPMFIKSRLDNSTAFPTWTKGVEGAEDMGVGYQIFLASFADSDGDGMGDLRGVINKLDYLKDLGVDVLWLTPFQTSTNYHGYDINDYYSVDSRFGTEADYRELISKVHEKGMKIVMDFVLNHTSKANDWFVKSQNLVKETREDGTVVDYRQFYTWINETKYNQLGAEEKKQWFGDAYGYYFYSSFGNTMPELNYDYQPVRDAILDVCDHWMKAGLDGFRLDAVKHIYMTNEVSGKGNKSGTTAFSDGASANGQVNYDIVSDGAYSYDARRNFNFYREFNYRLKSKHPNAYVVGETLDGWDARIAGFYQGIDSQFDFNLYYAIPRGLAQASGVASGGDTGSIANITTYYQRGQKLFSAFNPKYIGGQFTSNHDLPRARNRVWLSYGSDLGDKYKKVASASDVANSDILLKLYYAANMTLPGVSWIYYGDEIGMDGVMQYTLDTGSTSSTDSQPHEDVIYRQPMKWKATGNSSYPIGFETKKSELAGANVSLIKSVEEQEQDANSLLNWMKKLTSIRKSKGIGATATMTNVSKSSNGECEYTVRGTEGSIKVSFKVGGTVTGNLAQFSGSVNGTPMSVAISNA